MMNEARFIHYRTGHMGIDAQNWNLFSVMNSINQACKDGDQVQAINDLDVLVELVKDHVQFEEDEMRHFGYPFSNIHAQEHQKLIKSTVTLDTYEHEHKWQYKRDEITQKIETMLLNHIDYHDVQFGNWLKEQKIEV